MILSKGDEPPTVVNVHTEKKIKRKKTGGGLVAIVTEPKDKSYRISFFKRRRLGDNSPSRSGMNRRGFLGRDVPL